MLWVKWMAIWKSARRNRKKHHTTNQVFQNGNLLRWYLNEKKNVIFFLTCSKSTWTNDSEKVCEGLRMCMYSWKVQTYDVRTLWIVVFINIFTIQCRRASAALRARNNRRSVARVRRCDACICQESNIKWVSFRFQKKKAAWKMMTRAFSKPSIRTTQPEISYTVSRCLFQSRTVSALSTVMG